MLGLLALLLLQDARRAARLDADGRLLLLAEQDRSRWDRAAITEGVSPGRRGAAPHPATGPTRTWSRPPSPPATPSPRRTTDTDWDAVVSWYDVLLTVHDTPVVRLNRAAAVAELDGPAAGLALVDAIEGVTGYPWWHATRAELLRRLDRPAEAAEAYDRALALDLSAPQADHLRRRRAELPCQDLPSPPWPTRLPG